MNTNLTNDWIWAKNKWNICSIYSRFKSLNLLNVHERILITKHNENILMKWVRSFVVESFWVWLKNNTYFIHSKNEKYSILSVYFYKFANESSFIFVSRLYGCTFNWDVRICCLVIWSKLITFFTPNLHEFRR